MDCGDIAILGFFVFLLCFGFSMNKAKKDICNDPSFRDSIDTFPFEPDKTEVEHLPKDVQVCLRLLCKNFHLYKKEKLEAIAKTKEMFASGADDASILEYLRKIEKDRCAFSVIHSSDSIETFLSRKTRLAVAMTPPNPNQATLQPITLSDEQQEIFDLMNNSFENLFITGRAGTGKSSLLNYFKDHTHKKVAVCAPTGIAALLVGGQTIHSLFKIDPQHPIVFPQNMKNPGGERSRLLRELTTLIIDEVSMVRADLMDGIDFTLRITRNNNDPFGGLQVIMFGDLFQLAPIADGNVSVDINGATHNISLKKFFEEQYGGEYFFNAKVWQNEKFRAVTLEHIFRQDDIHFKEALNELRVGDTSGNALAFINSRADARPFDHEKQIITLASTNKIADEMNSSELEKIDTPLIRYNSNINGNIKDIKHAVPEPLELKEGAQVMFTVNDSGDNNLRRWHNGTLGRVHKLTPSSVHVNIKGSIHNVPRNVWKNCQYVYDPAQDKIILQQIGSIEQFPLRLAWAITIHKSQGQTFDAVNIDLGSGAFANGQTYVALSRCKTLDGLYIKTPITATDIKVSQDVIDFGKYGFNYIRSKKRASAPVSDTSRPSNSGDSIIKKIKNAIATGESITIKYEDKSGKITTRRVTPKEIKNTGAKSMLVAHCHLRNDERNFLIHSIKSIS